MSNADGTSFIAITGPACSGKTSALVDRVAAALGAGTPADDILVFAATPITAVQLKRRLSSVGSSIRVTTPFEKSIEILGSDAARERTGRVPRILNEFEWKILSSDLEMIGGDRKRNKEIVKYLLREWTELGEDKERFIISSEEQNLHDGMKERLRARGGMLTCELANETVRYLREDAEALAAVGASAVFADDFQNLNLASQTLVELLARDTLVIAGDDAQRCEALDPYPYPDGVAAFITRHEKDALEVVSLTGSRYPGDAVSKLNRYLDSCSTMPEARFTVADDLGCASMRIETTASPAGELSVLAEEAGAPGVAASEPLVIVPSHTFGRKVARELARAGIPAAYVKDDAARWGNAEEPDAAGVFAAYSLLRLAADENDGVAWRTLCGLGDHLYNGSAWRAIELEAEATGTDVAAVLHDLSEGKAPAGEMDEDARAFFAELVRRADHAVALLRETPPEALVETLSHISGAEPVRLFGAFGNKPEDADAATWVRAISDRLAFARLRADGVAIATPREAAGARFGDEFITFALDGLYPSKAAIDPEETVNHRKYYLAEDERAFLAALTRFDDDLRISFPEKEEFAEAMKAHLGISRIFSAKGVRMAKLAASRFVKPMMDGAPAPKNG